MEGDRAVAPLGEALLGRTAASVQHGALLQKHKTQKPLWLLGFWWQDNGTPKGIRIPAASVKGRCPRPLDDGGIASGDTVTKPSVTGKSVDALQVLGEY